MPVSLARMYENALDWEHLPFLHSSSFKAINYLESGDWGWRAEVVLADTDTALLPKRTLWTAALKKSLRHQPTTLLRFGSALAKQSLAARKGGAKVLLELRLDTERRRWITTTLAGPGQGTEIWTQVIEHGPEDIEVLVDFFIPNIPRAMAAPLGRYYQALYQRLYDEDQEMMEIRQSALLHKGKNSSGKEPLALGSVEAVKQRTPFLVAYAGREWRVLTHNDQLKAHATLCPHMLGPLDAARVNESGELACPWHDYRFDLDTGRNTGEQQCHLAKPPRISVESGIVRLGGE